MNNIREKEDKWTEMEVLYRIHDLFSKFCDEQIISVYKVVTCFKNLPDMPREHNREDFIKLLNGIPLEHRIPVMSFLFANVLIFECENEQYLVSRNFIIYIKMCKKLDIFEHVLDTRQDTEYDAFDDFISDDDIGSYRGSVSPCSFLEIESSSSSSRNPFKI